MSGLTLFFALLARFFGSGKAPFEFGVDRELLLRKAALGDDQLLLLRGESRLGFIKGTFFSDELLVARGDLRRLLGERFFTGGNLGGTGFDRGAAFFLLGRGRIRFVYQRTLRLDQLQTLLFQLFERGFELHFLAEMARFFFDQGTLARVKLRLFLRQIVTGFFCGSAVSIDLREGLLRSDDVGLDRLALRAEGFDFFDPRGGGGERGFGFGATALELRGRFLGGGDLLLPTLAFAVQLLKHGTRLFDFYFFFTEAFRFTADFKLKFFDLLPVGNDRFAFVGQALAFDGQRFLAFQQLDAVAAHDLHLLRQLVLPRAHLFELRLEDLGGVQDRVP